jgi:hypothetical protein
MSQEQKDAVLYEWSKSDVECIRATTSLWKGRRYFSIRLHFKGSDDEWHPTKRGITVGADHVGDLVKAIKAIAEAAKSDGGEERR